MCWKGNINDYFFGPKTCLDFRGGFIVYCKALWLVSPLCTTPPPYTQEGEKVGLMGNGGECIYQLQLKKLKHLLLFQVCSGSVISLGRKGTSAVATS